MTSDEFVKIMAVLELNYNQPPSVQKIDFYFSYLGQYEYDIMQRAVDELIMTNKYPTFPTIGSIMEVYNAIKYAVELSAGEAWGKVTDAVRRFSFYDITNAMESFDDLTRAAVRAIGWDEICHSTLPGAVRRDFLKVYEQLQKRKHDNDLRCDLARKMLEQANIKEIGDGK